MLEKQNLLGLTQVKLKKFFSDLDEKPFRTKQIMQWIITKALWTLVICTTFQRLKTKA